MKSEIRKIVRETLELLNEGIIKLTDNEVRQINDILPKVKNAIKNRVLYKGIASIDYVTADDLNATAIVYIYDKDDNSLAHHNSRNKKDLNDNLIGVNFNFFGLVYNGIFNKILSKMTNKTPDEHLITSLKHELIHAKDPAVNHKPLNQPVNSGDIKSYYGSWIEFPTQTGEFFEAISQRTKEEIEKKPFGKKLPKETIEKIFNIYDDILDFYSGKDKVFNSETAKWLSGGNTGNLFQKFVNGILSFGGVKINWSSDTLLPIFSNKIEQIKKYNPEGYKEFQKDLYKLITNLKEKLRR